jgi:tRNA dimethylallyltransferase
VCQSILDRGNVPIFVGGSGFYIHSLLYGPPSGPPPVPELRKSLEEEMDRFGVDAMYARLQEYDPQYAKSITKKDKQKIIRALEIITLTGKKVSKLSWVGRRRPQNYDFRCWFLHRPKKELYKRVEERCDMMIERGLIEETQNLIKEGLKENTSASQAIGYRQAIEFIESAQTEEDYRKFLHDIKHASKQYTKRQFTWFKREPLFRWLDLDMHDPEVALDIVMKDYETLP